MAARSGRGVATRGQLSLTSRGDSSTRYGTPTRWRLSGSGTQREGTGGEGPWRPTWSGRWGLRKGPSQAAGSQAAGVATGSGLRQAHLCGTHVWFRPPPSPPAPPPASGPGASPGWRRAGTEILGLRCVFLSFLAGTGRFERITQPPLEGERRRCGWRFVRSLFSTPAFQFVWGGGCPRQSAAEAPGVGMGRC